MLTDFAKWEDSSSSLHRIHNGAGRGCQLFITETANIETSFLVQIIWGALAQLLHLFTVPETRCSVLLDREAKRRRKEAAKEGKELNIWGPNEVIENRLTMKGILTIWLRPFLMLFWEPVVTVCSMLSVVYVLRLFTELIRLSGFLRHAHFHLP